MKRMLTGYCTALIKLVFMSFRKREFFLLKVFAFTWITILEFLWLNAGLSQLSRSTSTTCDGGCCPDECYPADHLFASEWSMSMGWPVLCAQVWTWGPRMHRNTCYQKHLLLRPSLPETEKRENLSGQHLSVHRHLSWVFWRNQDVRTINGPKRDAWTCVEYLCLPFLWLDDESEPLIKTRYDKSKIR